MVSYTLLIYEFSTLKQHYRLFVSLFAIITIFVFITEFSRNKIRFFQICFNSIDRPEDRPKTLFWLSTQTFAGYLILTFSYIAFYYSGVPINLLYLTILAVTIGDGIAEPIGIKFGKRKYLVSGFYDQRLYYRTLEGSLAVYLVSLILCYYFASFFNLYGFILLLIFYPIAITLVEAKSPHTWDTPFLFLTGNFLVMSIVLIQKYFI
jgi:phytol kinase